MEKSLLRDLSNTSILTKYYFYCSVKYVTGFSGFR